MFISKSLFFIVQIFLAFLADVMGKDIWVLSDAPSRGLFDFERRQHGRQSCEYFGLGLHLIVLPRRVPPASGSDLGSKLTN